MILRILSQTERWVAIDKPSGVQTHSPEDRRHRISPSHNAVALLRKQLGRAVHPVHRLDRATSGVLLFAHDPEAAAKLGALFKEHRIRKTYTAVCRGWIHESMSLDRPLKAEPPMEGTITARTDLEPVGRVELPYAVPPYATARYSLIRAFPHTGRRHQIRRHLAGASHPLVGDTVYGNAEHNHLFRDRLGLDRLLLKAHTLEFEDPFNLQPVRLQSRWGDTWNRVFDLFGVCCL